MMTKILVPVIVFFQVYASTLRALTAAKAGEPSLVGWKLMMPEERSSWQRQHLYS
jgi:hypothetical protein